jgi:hypothetical protein
MQGTSLRFILERAEKAKSIEQLRAVCVDLALALIQLNAEVPDKTRATRAAALSYLDKKRTLGGR